MIYFCILVLFFIQWSNKRLYTFVNIESVCIHETENNENATLITMYRTGK